MALAKRLAPMAAAAAFALAFFVGQAAAAPATMRFSGTISDPSAPGAYPQGTAVDWQINLDDAFNALDWPDLLRSPIWAGPQAIAGSATIGASNRGFDRLELLAVSTPDFVAIQFYQFIAWFSAPTDDLTGVWLILDNNLQPFLNPGSTVPSLGLVGPAAAFAWETTGTYTLMRESTVAAPATAWLLLPTLALLALQHRRAPRSAAA